MYRVLLERAAEKDLSRLASEMHDRVDSNARDEPTPAQLPQIGREQERLAHSRWRLPRDLRDR